MLNDTSVASAGSYIRTCRRIRNSKKIATIRDFHQNICVNPTRLQCAQNKVIRFILNKDFVYHIDHADFKSLGIVNINTRAEHLRLNHDFDIFYDTCPE